MLKNDQLIKVKWGPNKQSHFRQLGYNFHKGDIIYVKPNELMPNSHERVYAVCEQCGNISGMEYRQYVRASSHFDGHFYCHRCTATFDSVTEKRRQTCEQKYGVSNPMQVQRIREKQNQSMCGNGTVPTSQQQLKIFNMLVNCYGSENCKLNMPLSDLALDCVININDVQIDIEYDGWYWHQDKQKDRRRDEFVKSQGYKVLRIKSIRTIPTIEAINDKINILLNTDKTYQEIVVPQKNSHTIN